MIRVIGTGASSVVYQAVQVDSDDLGMAVKKTYPLNVLKNVETETINDINNVSNDTVQKTPEKKPLTVEPSTEPIERVRGHRHDVALKFSDSVACLRQEIDLDSVLPECFRVGWKFNVFQLNSPGVQVCKFSRMPHPSFGTPTGLFVIIGPRHTPLVNSVFGVLSTPISIGRENLFFLLENLFAIHAADVVHRDIRIANILYKSIGGVNQFIISDFGFVVNRQNNEIYRGTIETASQRILQLLYRGEKKFQVTQEDDLESFLKLVKLIYGRMRAPEPMEEKKAYCEKLFRFWLEEYDVEQFVKLKTLTEKRAFLQRYCMPKFNDTKAAEKRFDEIRK